MAGRITQLPVEPVLEPADQTARVTQEPVETVLFPTSEIARVTQEAVEVGIAVSANVRMTQAVAEVLILSLARPRSYVVIVG